MPLHFQALFKDLPFGAYRCNGDGRFVRVNPAMCALTGDLDEAAFLAASRLSRVCRMSIQSVSSTFGAG